MEIHTYKEIEYVESCLCITTNDYEYSGKFTYYLALSVSFLDKDRLTYHLEASGGAVARGVEVKPTGCGFDPHPRK